jgi:hypothetical protein
MKKIVQCTGLTVFVVVILLQIVGLTAQKQPQQKSKETGAKVLFYDPATGATLKPGVPHKVKQAQPDQVKYVGVHYWIELSGKPESADRVFHTGDRIRLHVRSNVDGYLSLWTLDPSGRGDLLFPAPGQKEGENLVKADTDYVTPGDIVFKLPVQDERLLVFFSRSQKDIPAPTGTATDAQAVAKTLGPEGGKALAFETEKKTPEEVGTYVVNKKGGPVASEIRLKHQPREGKQ